MNISPKQREEWSRALGRLPSARKVAFIARAAATLERAQQHRALHPSEDDWRALIEIAERAESLATALARADRLELPAAYLRSAWREASGAAGANDDFPESISDTLRRLAEAARRWAPDSPVAAHRPRDDGPGSLALAVLAEQFRAEFGMSPTYGSGSPYMKFLRVALPAYGFAAPSAQKARDPLG